MGQPKSKVKKRVIFYYLSQLAKSIIHSFIHSFIHSNDLFEVVVVVGHVDGGRIQ